MKPAARTSPTPVATTDAPGAIGPYSQGIRAGGLVFVSGQIPLDPATGQLVAGDVTAQTERVMANLRAILVAAGGDLRDVVRTTIYLTDLAHFAEVNAAYGRHFAEPYPARATVQVVALPRGAQVEIDAVAVVPRAAAVTRRAPGSSGRSPLDPCARVDRSGIDRATQRDVDAGERPGDREPVPRSLEDDPPAHRPRHGDEDGSRRAGGHQRSLLDHTARPPRSVDREGRVGVLSPHCVNERREASRAAARRRASHHPEPLERQRARLDGPVP